MIVILSDYERRRSEEESKDPEDMSSTHAAQGVLLKTFDPNYLATTSFYRSPAPTLLIPLLTLQ